MGTTFMSETLTRKDYDMLKIKKLFFISLAFFLLANSLAFAVWADSEEHHQKKHHQKEKTRTHSEHDGEDKLMPVNNKTYTDNCGQCHIAYPPALLPSGSWNQITSGLEDHFGQPVQMDAESLKIISGYLAANAADVSTSKPAKKIMRSLTGQTPMRITEIPYIQKEHHEISKDILGRESIGSLSNCLACHTAAVKGDYDDDTVTIPN